MCGFTLIEMMVTFVIMVILATLGISVADQFWQVERDKSMLVQMKGLMQYASESSRRMHRIVYVCIEVDDKCEQSGSDEMIVFVVKSRHDNRKIILRKLQLGRRVRLVMRSYSGSQWVTRFYPKKAILSGNSLYYFCHRGSLNPALGFTTDRMARFRMMMPDKKGEIIDSHHRKIFC